MNVPMIRALFEQLTTHIAMESLGFKEMLDRTGEVLNRVDRRAFFENFDGEGAVQYFYEPFLEAFDPELRKQLGVWYTPPEVVHYMVERVDTILREELDLADGLAAPNVYVLDPCVGTGSFLVEVLKRIEKTLREMGEDALSANDFKHAAMERVFGFEILPAPFVVAHLQIGLLLQNLKVPLSEEGGERVGVFLTNALTGWEEEAKERLPFAELEEERKAAGEIKRQKPILVVLGNPPYNGFAGVAVEEERALSMAYRTTKHARAPHGQGLNDLYIRFFRMAERQIVEGTQKGIVCFISNYTWLDGLSFPGMRERYLEVFDRIWIDCLNGDRFKTGKVTPEGLPDPSIFSTDTNPEGIQVGTAIATLVRNEPHKNAESIQFRHLWGREKRVHLLETSNQEGKNLYQQATPPLGLGLPFVPIEVQVDYPMWPLLPDIFPTSFSGVQTRRDDLVVDTERERLKSRLEQYFDPSISDAEIARRCPRAMMSTAQYDPKLVRGYLTKRGFLPQYIVRYCYRPFDIR